MNTIKCTSDLGLSTMPTDCDSCPGFQPSGKNGDFICKRCVFGNVTEEEEQS